MNEITPNRSNERPDMWLGRDADDSPEIVDVFERPVPLVVVDSTEIKE
jgi:hypothetical protein